VALRSVQGGCLWFIAYREESCRYALFSCRFILHTLENDPPEILFLRRSTSDFHGNGLTNNGGTNRYQYAVGQVMNKKQYQLYDVETSSQQPN
jgi:hypothetical protein